MEEELVNAHKHFRSVITCSSLVATINGGGQTRLTSEPQTEIKSLRSLLNYVPAVLVRNIEVIAAVAHGPHPPTLTSRAASGSLRVDIVQDAPLSGPSEKGGDLGLPLAVTAVANLYVEDFREGDPYFTKDSPGPDCLMVTSGRSHLDFMDDPSVWKRYLFEIGRVSLVCCTANH